MKHLFLVLSVAVVCQAFLSQSGTEPVRRPSPRFVRAVVSGVVETDTSPLPDIQKDGSADAVICGGGPAGLLSAIMLAQKFPEVSDSDGSLPFWPLVQLGDLPP